MAVLSIWSVLLVLRTALYRLLGKDESRLFLLRNRCFPVLVCSLGVLYILGIARPDDFYILNNSFATKGLSNQLNQCFVLIPLLVIFSQVSRYFTGRAGYFESDMPSFLLAGFLVALSTYNINIIFFVSSLYELFIIEKKRGALKKLRREIATLLVVLFPFVMGLKGVFLNLFFLLLVILNILDVAAFAQGDEKEDESHYGEIIFFFPLRMTLLAYYGSEAIAVEYLGLIRIIFIIAIIISFLYGFLSYFNPRSRLVVAQVLLLSGGVSVIGHSYMETYFLLGLLLLYGVNAPSCKSGQIYQLMGPFLIVLLPFIDGGSGIVGILGDVLGGDNYSKFVGYSLLFFLTVLAFQWGHSLKLLKTLDVSHMDKYKGMLIVACIFLNARYHVMAGDSEIDWANKIIISFYFIIILLLSFAINMPTIEGKKINKYWLRVSGQLLPKKHNWVLISSYEKILRFLLNKVFLTVFFVQGVLANTFFILVDVYEHKRSKKYQSLAIFLLIVFLFIWIKIFASR